MKSLVRNMFIMLCCLSITDGLAQTATLPESPWPFLDTETIGAYDFIKSNPTFDGRGVVIIIVDTGVDMGVPGLLKTSTGKIKVIDARDFSGQGDVPLTRARIDSSNDTLIFRAGDFSLTGVNKVRSYSVKSGFWIGAIDEKKNFQSSRLTDLNNNGETDDIFAFVTFQPDTSGPENWVYFLDEDGDGDISDEKPRMSYRFHHDTFTFGGRDSLEEKRLVTGVLNIYPEEKKAVFHIPDGSHGTHCAGIAAGYQIFGEPTMDGIAPGAQIISAKIGNNLYGGGSSTTGAMKKAYEFGVEWSKQHETPVIFSMSYGIGSELEGHSDIELFLDSLMAANENILVVLSNGNNGPGIGSTGNPSSASRPISIGAMLPVASAVNTYGFPLDHDVIFHFSSRGGEVDKPDCLAPGAAASTVPYYDSRENKWGTSMACPQVAGAAAVLVSACMQENIPYNASLLKRALKFTAVPLPGYTHLDQGTGVVNIPAAFGVMKKFQKREESGKLLDYKVKTVNPFYPDQTGRTAYWRTGTYYPPETTKQQFSVEPLFPHQMTADEKAGFYRAYNLKTEQEWFKLDKSSTYIRGENAARIGGYYQHEMLRKPGLYVAVIKAFPRTGDFTEFPEFELINSVIVPYQFSSENDYRQKFNGVELKTGEYKRFFVLVPPGASSMNVRIETSPGKWSGIRTYIFDPCGRKYTWVPDMNPDTRLPVEVTVSGETLIPGTWEIVPFAFFDLNKISTFDLEIRFDGLQTEPSIIHTVKFQENGQPEGHFSITNLYRYFEGTGTGRIDGFERTWTVDISGDTYRFEFETGNDGSQVFFTLTLDQETYNLFTDIAVNVRDSSGKIVETEGLGQRQETVKFEPADSGTYTCEIVGGFMYPAKAQNGWKINITEKHFVTEPIQIQVEKDYQKNIVLYPSIREELSFELTGRPASIPQPYLHSGKIDLRNEAGENVVEIPIKMKQQSDETGENN